MFLENGVKASDLDDYQLAREHQPKDSQFSILFLFVVMISFLAALISQRLLVSHESKIAIELSLLSLVVLNFCVAAASFRNVAIDRGYLPNKNSDSGSSFRDKIQHNHITGFGAAVILLLLGFLVIAAVLGQRHYKDFSIPEEFGLLVMLLISGGFLSLIFAPRFTDFSIFHSFLSMMRGGTSFLNPIGRFLSRVDSWLVHVFAPITGVTANGWFLRYCLLGGNLVSASLFAWFGPPVFASLAVVWAVLIAISISRRWSWIESDRDEELRGESNRPFARIEISQDLRDEALFALLFLIFILPLGMRQVHQIFDGSIFTVAKQELNDPLAWLGFFGVEMIKALPFVDWSDIYGAHGATAIKFENPSAMHLVFGSRVLIDLVFLSALVQAISISVSLGKHKRRFLGREVGVTKLDSRIEVTELSKLARRDRSGNWHYRPEISQYLHYDPERLSFLRIKCRKNERLRATIGRIFEINDYSYQPPGEKLVEEAMQAHPDENKIMEHLDFIEELGDYDLGYLEPARQQLNHTGGVQDARLRIADFILRAEISPEKERALSNMSLDSWAPVRAKVIPVLGRNRASAEGFLEVLTHIATSDGARSLQDRARKILRKYGLGGKLGTLIPD